MRPQGKAERGDPPRLQTAHMFTSPRHNTARALLARPSARARRAPERIAHVAGKFLVAALAGTLVGLVVGFALGQALVATAPVTLDPEVPLRCPLAPCHEEEPELRRATHGPAEDVAVVADRALSRELAERAQDLAADALKSRWLRGDVP